MSSSEEFLAHQLAPLEDDLDAFNEALIEYLLWYNIERPHQSLGMLSPLQYIVKSLPEEECQMYWNAYIILQFRGNTLHYRDAQGRF